MTVIRDPSTQKGMTVTEEGQGVVRSISEEELEHASAGGRAYSWYSGARDIDATDTMLFLRNDSDVTLILDRMDVIGSNVACTWTIRIGADVTTPTGTTVTGVNLNQVFTSTAAKATASFDEEAVADGTAVRTFHTAATVQAAPIDLTGFILGEGHYIQINQETESTAGSVAIIGHYENPA